MVHKDTSVMRETSSSKGHERNGQKREGETDDEHLPRDTIKPGRMVLIPKRYKANLGADAIAGLTNSIDWRSHISLSV